MAQEPRATIGETQPTRDDCSAVLGRPGRRSSQPSPTSACVAGPDRGTRVTVYHLQPWTVSDPRCSILFLSHPTDARIQHVADAKEDLDPVWHSIPYRFPPPPSSSPRPLGP